MLSNAVFFYKRIAFVSIASDDRWWMYQKHFNEKLKTFVRRRRVNRKILWLYSVQIFTRHRVNYLFIAQKRAHSNFNFKARPTILFFAGRFHACCLHTCQSKNSAKNRRHVLINPWNRPRGLESSFLSPGSVKIPRVRLEDARHARPSARKFSAAVGTHRNFNPVQFSNDVTPGSLFFPR